MKREKEICLMYRNVILNLFQDLSRLTFFINLIIILVFNLSSSFYSYSQTITHGPIVGAVTDSSAKIILFTDNICNGEIQISKNTDFKYILNFPFLTNKINIVSVELKNLESNTQYFYRISINKIFQNQSGSFKTFPINYQPANFSFTLGSCTEKHHNDSIFIEMQKHEPAFFLHLGDWLYPDNFKEDKFYYDESLAHQKELYQKRYEMPNLKTFLQTTSIDFVFDDEDGVYDDFSKYSYTELKMNNNVTEMKEVAFPDSLRKMAIEGLHTFFPGYNEVKGQAYHSFVYGNTEIFFLDTRSTRSPNSEVFTKTKNGKWKYKVPKGHNILDSAQLNWLLNKLQNSKAEWKFIVSGVTFNKSYKKIVDIAMLKRIQNRKLPNNMTGAYISASLASMWFAFPETQAQLLNFCHDNKIKNVIVLSGDAHTAAIDNGINAGFPELMAGGLAQKNSRLASIIKNNLKLNLWNQGGQGIGNANFNDAFGKVTINGNESVTLSCVDKYGNLICSYEVKNGFLPKSASAKKNKTITLGNNIKAAKQALKIKKTI